MIHDHDPEFGWKRPIKVDLVRPKHGAMTSFVVALGDTKGDGI